MTKVDIKTLSPEYKDKIVELFHGTPMNQLERIAEELKSSKNWQTPILAMEMAADIDWPVIQGSIVKSLVAAIAMGDLSLIDENHIAQLEKLSEFAQHFSQAEKGEQIDSLKELR